MIYIFHLYQLFGIKKKGKILYGDIISGKKAEEDLKCAIKYNSLNQQDFSEGIAAQAPHDVLDKISPEMNKYAIHDISQLNTNERQNQPSCLLDKGISRIKAYIYDLYFCD